MKDVVKWSVFERYRKEQVNRNTLKIHYTSTYKTLRSESGKPQNNYEVTYFEC